MRRTLRKEVVDWFEHPAEVTDILSDEPPPDEFTRAVYVFAFEGNELLMAKQRGDENWTLPGGERKDGESTEDAARRLVNLATGCDLDEIERFGWQQVQFADKVPADWRYGANSFIRLYRAGVASVSGLQASNRRFFAPVEARALPAVQENHLFYEEALLVALDAANPKKKAKKRS